MSVRFVAAPLAGKAIKGRFDGAVHILAAIPWAEGQSGPPIATRVVYRDLNAVATGDFVPERKAIRVQR